MSPRPPEEPFAEWAIVELMGHRRLAGRLTEATIAGSGFLRLDIPGEDPESAGTTQFYAPGSVYAITPTTEDICLRLAFQFRPPVQRWELEAPTPPRLPAFDREAPPPPDPDGLSLDDMPPF